jgi:hypothetical protein
MSKTAATPDNASSSNVILVVMVAIWLIATIAFFVWLAFVDQFLWMLIAGLLVPVLFSLWLVPPAIAVLVFIARLRQRQYGAASLSALVPFAGLLLLTAGPYLGAFIRFAIERPIYEARINAARAGAIDFKIVSGTPIVAFFPWGGSAFASYGVVFDESDVIAKPLPERQAAWRYRAVPGELLCGGGAERLSGHFYLGHFAC